MVVSCVAVPYYCTTLPHSGAAHLAVMRKSVDPTIFEQCFRLGKGLAEETWLSTTDVVFEKLTDPPQVIATLMAMTLAQLHSVPVHDARIRILYKPRHAIFARAELPKGLKFFVCGGKVTDQEVKEGIAYYRLPSGLAIERLRPKEVESKAAADTTSVKADTASCIRIAESNGPKEHYNAQMSAVTATLCLSMPGPKDGVVASDFAPSLIQICLLEDVEAGKEVVCAPCELYCNGEKEKKPAVNRIGALLYKSANKSATRDPLAD